MFSSSRRTIVNVFSAVTVSLGASAMFSTYTNESQGAGDT